MSVRPDRILFVDDDVELREIVKTQLTEVGYEVHEADDGATALKRLETEKFQLILLDITLPGKNGLEILRFVKQRSLDCKVIMLTGVIGLATAIESLTMGADDYITKPYNLEHLLSSIKRVLEGEQA